MSFNPYPTNPNFLSPLGFRFQIQRMPNVTFFTQQASIPTVTLGTANVPTPFSNIPVPGDHLVYSDFTLSFKVDEDMNNYIEVYNWMVALGFPDSFDQYKGLPGTKFVANPNGIAQLQKSTSLVTDGMYSDGILEILNSAKKSIAEVRFVDMYPTMLSDVTFNTRESDVNYIEATVSFAYRTFQINRVT